MRSSYSQNSAQDGSLAINDEIVSLHAQYNLGSTEENEAYCHSSDPEDYQNGHSHRRPLHQSEIHSLSHLKASEVMMHPVLEKDLKNEDSHAKQSKAQVVSASSSSSPKENMSTMSILPSEPMEDSNHSSDSFIHLSPPAFTIDVKSALDHVLSELQNGELKTGVLNYPYCGTRPCILQQTLFSDNNSSGILSGESTPGILNAYEDVTKCDQISSPILLNGSARKLQSPHLEASMMLPEDSLSIIAQMTVSTKHDVDSSDHVIKDPLSQTNTYADNGRKMPLISGTAAAAMDALQRRNNSFSSEKSKDHKALVAHALKKPKLIYAECKEAKTLNPTSMTSREEDIESVNRHEKGMNMLADITSHAAPISSVIQTDDIKKIKSDADESSAEYIEIPVGQSLSVYSKIAKDAGVVTLKPLPLVQSDDQICSYDVEDGTYDTGILETKQVTIPLMDTPVRTRDIGKIRRYIAATGEFSDWEDLPCQTYGDKEPRRWNHLNIDESIEIPLRRGGRLRVFPNFLSDVRRNKVAVEMNECTLYRQYSGYKDDGEMEPRTQVLLSSEVSTIHSGGVKKARPGYYYDGVTMMAQPLSHVPQVQLLASDLAELYRLPEKQWNIGATLVCYRTGEDHMTWSSNFEQGEVLILCTVIESLACTRPILIRPKDNIPLQEGDEEIIVFVGQGDAYEMDGAMQTSYEHCVPKKDDDLAAKRSVVVFRHGNRNNVLFDSGVSLVNEEEQSSVSFDSSPSGIISFGHPPCDIIEGKEVYTKEMLSQSGAHHFERRWVSGTIRDGCDSILVERQDPLLREDDGLCWLQITSSRNEGGAALYQSFLNATPIRVFRSSQLDSRYAPDLYTDELGQIIYRYDGLYAVKAIWDSDGDETDEAPPTDGSQYTFLLTRYPKLPADGAIDSDDIYNRISVQELWNEIQKRRQVIKFRPFQFSHPITTLAPIGDKSNLARRRKDIIELPSESNSKLRKKRRKIVGNNDDHQDPNNIPEAEIEIAITDMNSICSVQPESKPKRASAKAARSYLQEAMQNKFGSQEKEKLPISDRDERLRNNLMSIENLSKSDENAIEQMVYSDEMTGANESNVNHLNSSTPVKLNDVKQMKRSYTRRSPVIDAKRNKRVRSNVDDTNQREVKSNLSVDPRTVSVGSRIHVDYKEVLYKASVHRVRVRDDIHEFLVHYDGNKKSNLRWIQAKMIKEVLSNGADVVEEVEPISGTKRSTGLSLTIPECNYLSDHEDESTAATNHSDSPENNVPFLYKKGDSIYVDYKNVLYIACVQNTRINRKGVKEYFVHYEGFKKTSDRWMAEDSLVEVNEESTKKYNSQRGEETTIGKNSSASNKAAPFIPSRNSRQNLSERNQVSSGPSVDMGSNEPGVDFLPGSCVFVVRDDALYLAKMLKRRGRAPHMEYFVHYDGSSDNYDSWVPVSSIYEINPRTRRIYESTSYKRDVLNDGVNEDDTDDDSNINVDAVALAKGEKTKKRFDSLSKSSSRPKRKTSEEVHEEEENKGTKIFSRLSDPDDKSSLLSNKSANIRNRNSSHESGSTMFNMGGIEAGVEFLPGSTVFIVWKNALFLGKMLKKRGKGADMEYFVHYDGFRKSADAWVSASMIYEINPQTKRAFNKQKRK